MSTEVEKVSEEDHPIRQRDARINETLRYCTNEWKIRANEKETEKMKSEVRREIEMNKNK